MYKMKCCILPSEFINACIVESEFINACIAGGFDIFYSVVLSKVCFG